MNKFKTTVVAGTLALTGAMSAHAADPDTPRGDLSESVKEVVVCIQNNVVGGLNGALAIGVNEGETPDLSAEDKAFLDSIPYPEPLWNKIPKGPTFSCFPLKGEEKGDDEEGIPA